MEHLSITTHMHTSHKAISLDRIGASLLHRWHACLPSTAFNHSTHAHTPGGNFSGRVAVAVDPPLTPINTSPPTASLSSPSNPSYSACFSTCSPCSSSSSLLKLTRQTRQLLGALLLMRQRAIIAAFGAYWPVVVSRYWSASGMRFIPVSLHSSSNRGTSSFTGCV